jgi:hypothetical protein
VRPSQPLPYSYLLTSQTIDINGDGTPDFNLNTPNGIQIDLNPLNDNAIAAVPEPPGDLGVLIYAFPTGATISSSLDPPLVWYDHNSPSGGLATIVASSTAGSIGYFQGSTDAYAGLQLVVGGSTYYGWIHIQNLGLNIGQISDWAYETSPNTPILAGQVPEPSTAGLLLLGFLGLALRRKHLNTF